MAFANMWPFLFLLLIPAVIILYLLKQKSIDYKVASLYLWKEAYKNNTATTPFQKFRNNILLYLQITTILILIIALAAPFIKNIGAEENEAIIVIDNSASMQRMYDSENTRLDEAIVLARDYIKNMSANANITVVMAADIAKVCVSNANDKTTAIKGLKDIEQTDLVGNMDSAINLLYALTNGREDIEVIVFTDEVGAFANEAVNVVDMARNNGNSYISLVSHSDTEEGLDVIVTANNGTDNNINTDINLYGDGNMLAVENITIEAGGSANILFDNIKFSGEVLWAELNDEDALNKDNIYYDKISNMKNAKTLFVTEQNVFLEKVLLACGNFELFKANGIDNIPEGEEYALYIFDGVAPKKLPKQGSVLFINSGIEDIFKSKVAEGGGIINIQPTEYTEYLNNYTFGVNAYNTFEVPSWSESFMTINKECVAFAGEHDGRSIAAIGFDLHNSQFPLEAEFPILMIQLLNKMIDSDFVSINNLTAGDAISLNGKIDGEDMKIIDCETDDIIATFDAGTVYYGNTDKTGIFNVSQKLKDGTTKNEKFAVNFPISESVDVISDGEANINSISINDIRGDFNLRPYVIFTCILMFMIEWIVYLKRL